MGDSITRPLWRSFKQRFVKNAAAHVRAGGHAMVWRPGTPRSWAWMILPRTKEGEPTEMALWSMLALDKMAFDHIASGAARGLITLRIPRCYESAVEDWCERDSRWRGSTRTVELDCLTCAACCRNNRVYLDDDDFKRWDTLGRPDLRKPDYLRTEKGKVLLRLVENGDCVHLLPNKYCNIYTVRPDNCSMFPAGSEPCLGARKDEFGWIE